LKRIMVIYTHGTSSLLYYSRRAVVGEKWHSNGSGLFSVFLTLLAPPSPFLLFQPTTSPLTLSASKPSLLHLPNPFHPFASHSPLPSSYLDTAITSPNPRFALALICPDRTFL